MPPEEIAFPKHAWKEGQVRPAVEVSIDFLPEKYQIRWHRAVQSSSNKWVLETKFQKIGTIWMRGCVTTKLISRHLSNPVPSWSDFLIQLGLPTAFWDILERHLSSEFEGQCGTTEMLPANPDMGWAPICHIGQGQVWTLVEPILGLHL